MDWNYFIFVDYLNDELTVVAVEEFVEGLVRLFQVGNCIALDRDTLVGFKLLCYRLVALVDSVHRLA